MTFQNALKVWFILATAMVAAVYVSIKHFDVLIAEEFRSNAGRFGAVGHGLGSAVLIAGQLLIMTALAITRLIARKLSAFAKSVFIASSASISAFVANDYVFKFIFGRLNPSDFFLSPLGRVFHFFHGTYQSSFPSGHMVMSAAFAATMIRLHPWTMPVCAILICVAAAALVIGEWHFMGDVIAGTFIGGTVGIVAGQLWAEHLQRYPTK